ncbi:uncharacterized protein BDW70DRAFT_150635 [Aspergillus foveolatus]|uniref:uncharacterized protein n=1 Tax=Aspergillus foveolatus TaxID=210207 RepID=UPI003CCDCD3E
MSPSTSSHADYPLPSQGHQSPRPDQGAETPAAWGIGWRCPTLMIGLVTCGAMLSVGHHFYYRSFEETLVDSTDQQTWAIRIGTGFAFLIKSCLVSAVGVAATSQLEIPSVSFADSFWIGECQSLSEALLDVHVLSQALWDSEIGNTHGPVNLNSTLFVWAAGQNSLWNDDASRPTRLVCRLWNTSYVVGLSFDDGIQTLTPISVDHDIGPTVNWGFYVVHMLFSGLIQGDWLTGSTGSVAENITSQTAFTKLSIAQTGLFGCPEMWNTSAYDYLHGDSSTTSCRNGTLARAIEDLSQNFTYSLLSLNAANTTVDVLDLTSRNFYQYGEAYLILAYTTAIGVAVACVTVGSFALWRNGVSQNTSFSSVLITTRNLEQDRLAVGHCLVAEPLKKEIGKVRLQYGEIEGSDPQYKHAAFGTKGSVTVLTKGEDYF